jgi:hypothetical protein
MDWGVVGWRLSRLSRASKDLGGGYGFCDICLWYAASKGIRLLFNMPLLGPEGRRRLSNELVADYTSVSLQCGAACEREVYCLSV